MAVRNVPQNRCFKEFRNIYRKTQESLFSKVTGPVNIAKFIWTTDFIKYLQWKLQNTWGFTRGPTWWFTGLSTFLHNFYKCRLWTLPSQSLRTSDASLRTSLYEPPSCNKRVAKGPCSAYLKVSIKCLPEVIKCMLCLCLGKIESLAFNITRIRDLQSISKYV